MKKIIGLILLMSIGLVAENTNEFKNENNYKGCIENNVDNTTSIFVCKNEQYVVEYYNSNKNSSIKITLINHKGEVIIIKDVNDKN